MSTNALAMIVSLNTVFYYCIIDVQVREAMSHLCFIIEWREFLLMTITSLD